MSETRTNPFDAAIWILDQEKGRTHTTAQLRSYRAGIQVLEYYPLIIADRDSLRARLEKWERLIEAAGKVDKEKVMSQQLCRGEWCVAYPLIAALPDPETTTIKQGKLTKRPHTMRKEGDSVAAIPDGEKEE